MSTPTPAHKVTVDHAIGLSPTPRVLDDQTEKRVDEIEMLGEEEAIGVRTGQSQIHPNLRFLHSSRTIHQLITDRNRAVGVFLAVASLLWTASGAILNAKQ